MTWITAVDRFLDRMESMLIALLCSFALLLGVLQVLLRYIFNTGFHWNEAVFVTLTIWAMLLGASRAISTNLHARVEIVTENLPPAGVRILNGLAILSALLLSAVYLIGGVLYVRFVDAMDIRDLDTNIPDAVTYGIVPVASTLFVARYVLKLLIWSRDPGEWSRSTPGDHAAGV